MENANPTPAQIDALLKDIADLKTSREALLKDLADLKAGNKSLQENVAALKLKANAAEIKAGAKPEAKPVIPEKNVTVDGKEYKFLKAKFYLIGDSTLHLAEEAQHDEALLKKIIAISGQKILQEQV